MAPVVRASSSAARTFDFVRQQVVEILVTSALVEAWQQALPAGYALRRVPKEEQHRGDLCLEAVGCAPLYLELKTEAYPASLFLEPIQFWQRPSGDITYSRSWGFTTSAQLMLYLSGRTGQLLLCPRKDWLSTGMKLFQAYLLGTRHDTLAFRPYVTVNSKADYRGVRHYSGGAAGAAMETTSWLRAYQALGHDTDLLRMADGTALIDAAKTAALALSGDDIRELLKSLKRKADDATVGGVREELLDWAKKPGRDEAASEQRALRELLQVYHEVKGMPATAQLPAASTLVGFLSKPELAALPNQPLADDMWFLAATCLQCPWTKHNGAETDRLLAQAQATPMLLDPKGLPASTAVPEKMRALRMRFGADVARHGPRPGWEKVRDFVLEADPQQLRQWQGEYFRAHQHPAKATAPTEPVPA